MGAEATVAVAVTGSLSSGCLAAVGEAVEATAPVEAGEEVALAAAGVVVTSAALAAVTSAAAAPMEAGDKRYLKVNKGAISGTIVIGLR